MNDTLREMFIQQKYVPENCTLPGQFILVLKNKGECPCDGCNEDRGKCKGKEKKQKYGSYEQL